MMITAIGITTAIIPSLHALSIGGRLLHCVAAWKLISSKLWIVNVVRFGYKFRSRINHFNRKFPTIPRWVLKPVIF